MRIVELHRVVRPLGLDEQAVVAAADRQHGRWHILTDGFFEDRTKLLCQQASDLNQGMKLRMNGMNADKAAARLAATVVKLPRGS